MFRTKMNYNETEVLRIGKMKYSNNKIHTKNEITWTRESLKILGVEISAEKRTWKTWTQNH